MNDHSDKFDELAAALAANHLWHASAADFDGLCDQALTGKAPRGLPPRVVVVVGAGASNSACGLPGGAEAAKHLRKEMSDHINPELIEEEIEAVALQHGLQEEDFEAVLFALSKFARPSLLDKLSAIFLRRYHPWLGYEILAHLFKHRFIDAIVNFNFDEILDQSIEDELGHRAFKKVVLDGDCPEVPADWMDENKGRFTLPLYLKPHGSASQPSSMRFTRESYTALSKKLLALLKELFTAKQRVFVLVYGHTMQSVEFNNVLKKAHGSRLNSNPIRFYFADSRRDRFQTLAGILGDRASLSFCQAKPDGRPDLEAFMRDLWRRVVDQFKSMKPRGIGRHELISAVFAWRKDEEGRWKKAGSRENGTSRRLGQYSRDRIYLEVALAVAKAKGFVILSDLALGRAGTYLQLYRERGLVDRSPIRSLRDVCRNLGLNLSGYGGDVATVLPIGSDKLTVEWAEFESFDMATHLKGRLSLDSKNHFDTNLARRVFHEMYKGDEVEVVTRPSEELLLTRPEFISSLTALKWRTSKIIGDHSQWDRMVCIAESGEWLSNFAEQIKERGKRLAVVVADKRLENPLGARFGNALLAPRSLPWWLHNRHVTVFLYNRTPRFAVSFERRVRTTWISPFYLEDPDDVRLAWEQFVAYWLRSDQYSRKTSGDELVVDTHQLRVAEQQLLDELYDSR